MIGNFQHRVSQQGLMTQSALITPVYISNRRLENMNCIYEPTEKMGGLFLGDVISTLKADLLQQHQIKAVLSCMNDRVSLPMMLAHKILPIQDTIQYPIYRFFEEATEWIDSKRKEGHNVLVHCHAGVSRSATIVISYLMRFKGWTAHEALSYVRMRRERAKPNAGFWNQLLQYQNQLTKHAPTYPLAENLKNNQTQFNENSSKQHIRTPERYSEHPSSENQYQIRVFTAKRQQLECTPVRHPNGQRQEPRSHPHHKRKRIFDQQHFLNQNSSQSRRHQVLSTEPNLAHSIQGKKFSHSIIFSNQREYLTSIQHHLNEDPFRQTKSALEYKVNPSQQPRSPQAVRYAMNQRGLSYVSPFQLGGYRRIP